MKNPLAYYGMTLNSLLVSHYYPCLILWEGLEWSHIRGYTWVGSNLACKYDTKMEVTDGVERSSLSQYPLKKFVTVSHFQPCLMLW